MDPELVLPDDLSTLEPDDLTSLRDRITERATELRELPDEEVTDEVIAEMEQIAEAGRRVGEEDASRAAAEADRVTRAQAARDALPGAPAPEGEEETEPTDEEEDETEPTAAAPAPIPVAATTAPAAATTRAATVPAEPRRSPSALADARPSGVAPRPARRSDSFMRTTGNMVLPERREGQDLADRFEVATLIADSRLRMGDVPDGVHEDRKSMACGLKEIDRPQIAKGELENFGYLRGLREEYLEQTRLRMQGDPEEALVASGGGGYCNIYTPYYDFFRLAEPQSPIEDDLLTIPAPRAGIQFMKPMDFRAALGAVGTQTKAQNTAGAVKSKLALTCPQIGTAEVRAVYQIVQFDNLQYRVFPEQVEAFLEDVAVMFALTKENFYLSQIAGCSTAVSGSVPYGSRRGYLWQLGTAAAQYRKRNGMRRDAVLKGYLPDWTIDNVRADVMVENFTSLVEASVSDAEVVAAIRNLNIDPVFYNDLGNAANQIAKAQAAGNLNAWPTQAVSYLFAPGSFGRLDGGTLDLGLVRDSVLNGTNDLQLFMEEWLGLACLGIESIQLISTICPNGVAPASGAAFSC